MAVICLKARLEFGGGSTSIGDSIGGGGWRNDCCFCFSSTSSNVGKTKFLLFLRLFFLGPLRFRFCSARRSSMVRSTTWDEFKRRVVRNVLEAK